MCIVSYFSDDILAINKIYGIPSQGMNLTKLCNRQIVLSINLYPGTFDQFAFYVQVEKV